MNSAMSEFLMQRRSCVRLQAPAPDTTVLERLYQMAMRAPDHAQLKPCRFLIVQGEGREQLGEVFAEATRLRLEEAGEVPAASRLDRCRAMPLRAPMLIIVIATVRSHPKVPPVEQLASAACSAFALVLGLEAEGFGAVWRTGEMAYDPHVQQALGLATDEHLIGFLYCGTPEGDSKDPADPPPFATRMQSWPAGA